jgi:Ala-tRNA(Pro) deacylase
MGMAMKLADYLRGHPVQYELVKHPHTGNSRESAEVTHVPASCLAKAVVLEDEDGHLVMAILPASRKINLDELRTGTGRKLRLATEGAIGARFGDCELGAVPPVGGAYGMETIWDDNLASQPELYFEAGDHETLVHVKTSDFMRLLEGAPHMPFSDPIPGARPLF